MRWVMSAWVVLSLAAVQQSLPEKQAHATQREKNHATPDAPKTADSDATQAAQTGNAKQGKRAQEIPPIGKDRPWLQWKADVAASDVIAICAVGVAFLTLVMTALFLVYTIKTWEQMKRANDDAEKRYEESKGDIEKSLKLTRDGQEDTRRAIKVSENQLETLRRVARAWVTLTVSPWWNCQKSDPRKLHLEFTNTGFSPAFGFSPHGECVKVADASFLGNPKAQRILTGTGEHASQHNASPIGAGQMHKIEIDMPPPLTKAEYDDVKAGKLFVFIYGRIDYMDIFGESRYTTYAVSYEPAGYWSAFGDKYNEQT